MIRLAGTDLTEDALLELVVRLRRAGLDEHADRIVGALMSMQTEVMVTEPDRVTILMVLENPPAGLAELRDALLQEAGSREGSRLT